MVIHELVECKSEMGEMRTEVGNHVSDLEVFYSCDSIVWLLCMYFMKRECKEVTKALEKEMGEKEELINIFSTKMEESSQELAEIKLSNRKLLESLARTQEEVDRLRSGGMS